MEKWVLAVLEPTLNLSLVMPKIPLQVFSLLLSRSTWKVKSYPIHASKFVLFNCFVRVTFSPVQGYPLDSNLDGYVVLSNHELLLFFKHAKRYIFVAI